MGKLKTSKNSHVIPGAPMSDQEIKTMIKEAENGPFYTAQEVNQKIKEWKMKYLK